MNNEEELAVNEQVGDDANLDATPVSEQEASEEVEQAETESTDEVEAEPTETDGEPRRGAQHRIRELNAAKKAAEIKAQSLEQKLAELTKPVEFQGYQPNYNPQEPIVAPGEELDADELNRRIQAREQRIIQTIEARTHLRDKQTEAINRINSEAGEVIRQFPELDPESEQFNPELSETVTDAVEAYVKANPYTASVRQFAAKLMKPYRGAVAKEVGQATENLAKQVSQAALRPSSVRKEEKPASEKSIAELEADLGIVQA